MMSQPETRTPLTVACIGAGYFSQFHRGSWARMDAVTPVGVVDRDPALAGATGWPVFASVEALLEDHQPDIVDIITPPPSHLPLIREVLAAKPRAIICQKPFCTSLQDAQEAADLAQSAGVPLIVHENFRFQPWYRRIKAAMVVGEIGDVLQVTFRLRPGDGQGPEAYLDRQPYFQTMPRFLIHETAVHWVDTFAYLLGAPERIYADLRKHNPAIAGEDAGMVVFSYANGARALFDGNRLLDHAAVNTRCTMGEALVEGTDGTLTLTGDGAVRLRRFGQQESSEILAPTRHEGFGGDCVHALQSHVVAGLRGVGRFENEAQDYLSVIRQEEAIYRSSDLGQAVSL